MILITLSCSLLTIILIYLTTMTIDLTEFLLILACFVGIIWILHKDIRPNECFVDTDKNETDGWTPVDMEKLKQFVDLPHMIKDLIVKPIKQMTQNAGESSGGPNMNDLEPITEVGYMKEKDEYVGSERTIKGKKQFVIDQDLFKKMKTEYQKIDHMLVLLKKGNPQMYKTLVPEARDDHDNDNNDAEDGED